MTAWYKRTGTRVTVCVVCQQNIKINFYRRYLKDTFSISLGFYVKTDARYIPLVITVIIYNMSDQTNAVQGGIETSNHFVLIFLFPIFYFTAIQLIIAVFNLCVQRYICRFIFIVIQFYLYNNLKSVQSGLVVTGFRLS